MTVAHAEANLLVEYLLEVFPKTRLRVRFIPTHFDKTKEILNKHGYILEKDGGSCIIEHKK